MTSQQELTNELWDKIIASTKDTFFGKHRDYGSSWTVLRPLSLTAQAYIKAKRIITIQMNGGQQITGSENTITSEFQGIINYGIMGLIKMKLTETNETQTELPADKLSILFDEAANKVREIMIKKNTDYGAAWRDLPISVLADLIFQHLTRLMYIQKTGTSGASEGPEAKYTDCINYSVFALILINEGMNPME